MKANQEIRNEITSMFKAKGWNNRKIGLSVDYGKIVATVKDLSIRLDDVKEIVNSYEVIHYDEYCGEILAGVNTFVFVRYDCKTLSAARDEYLEKAEEIFEANNKGNILDIMKCGNKKLTFFGDCGCSWVQADGIKKYFAGNSWSLAEAMALFEKGGI